MFHIAKASDVSSDHSNEVCRLFCPSFAPDSDVRDVAQCLQKLVVGRTTRHSTFLMPWADTATVYDGLYCLKTRPLKSRIRSVKCRRRIEREKGWMNAQRKVGCLGNAMGNTRSDKGQKYYRVYNINGSSDAQRINNHINSYNETLPLNYYFFLNPTSGFFPFLCCFSFAFGSVPLRYIECRYRSFNLRFLRIMRCNNIM